MSATPETDIALLNRSVTDLTEAFHETKRDVTEAINGTRDELIGRLDRMDTNGTRPCIQNAARIDGHDAKLNALEGKIPSPKAIIIATGSAIAAVLAAVFTGIVKLKG